MNSVEKRGWEQSRRRSERWLEHTLRAVRTMVGRWRKGLIGGCGLSVCCVPLLAGPTAAAGKQQITPHVAQAESAPPALPASATERVLALSLEQAIRLALQNNLDIQRERLGPQVAHTQVERARAVFDPTIGLTTSLAQTKTLPQTRGFDPETGLTIPGSIVRPFSKRTEITPNFQQRIITGASYELRFINARNNVAPGTNRIVDPRYDSTLELVFTQPLLRDFGIAVNIAPIQQAQHTEEMAQQRLLQTVIDTIFAVQQGYWGLVFRMQDLDARRESQKLAEDFLAENRVRVALGTLAPIELVQAETQVKIREGDVIAAEAAVREAEDVLKEILNLPETMGTWRLRLQPTDTPPFVPLAAIPIDEKIAFALQHRPDIVQAQLTIASQEIARNVARNQRLPRVDFETRASVSGFAGDAGHALTNLGDAEGYHWSFLLRFAYPLGNRAANNELLRQNLLVKQAQITLRQRERTVVRDVFRAVRNVETASQSVEVRRAATVLARTQLEAEQEKFRLGLSTSFNVLQFQSQLTTARSEETRALSDYNIALAELDRATGTLHYGIR